MRSFLGYLLASILGTIIALGLLFLGLIMLGLISGMGKNKIKSGSTLVLELDSFYPEKSGNVSSSPFEFNAGSNIGFHEMISLIEHAGNNDNIDEILIKGNSNSLGIASTYDLMDALQTVKDSTDKPIIAYADFYSQKGYLLSSLADTVYLNPKGAIDLRGLGAMMPFFKEMLSKLGVNMQVFYAGEFKGASETYRRNNMSDQNRLQTKELLQELNGDMVDHISKNRNIDKSAVQAYMNELPIDMPQFAKSNGMVDELIHWHELEAKFRHKKGIDIGKKIPYISLAEYKQKTKYTKTKKGEDKIAVVFAEGEIVYSNDEKGVISQNRYHKVFDKIRKSGDYKAIVLRINSPGGNSFVSEVLLQEIKSLQKDGIKVIASYGDVSASGGYYMSCSADTIVAQENTITGSIGAFTMLPDMSNLLEDKLGISYDTVKTAPYSVAFSPNFTLNQGEQSKLQESIDKLYEEFLAHVAEGRDMTRDQVHAVAKGRIWSGNKAKEIGLVDEIGDLEKSIELAAESIGSDDYKLTYYPFFKKSPLDEIVQSFAQATEETSVLASMKSEHKEIFELFFKLKSYSYGNQALTRMPFMIIN